METKRTAEFHRSKAMAALKDMEVDCTDETGILPLRDKAQGRLMWSGDLESIAIVGNCEYGIFLGCCDPNL